MKVLALVGPGKTKNPVSAMLARREAAHTEGDPTFLEIEHVTSITALDQRLQRLGHAKPVLLVSRTEKSLGTVARSVEKYRVRLIPVAPDEDFTLVAKLIRAYRESGPAGGEAQSSASKRSSRLGVEHAVHALHDAESGRLNAKSIAELYGLPLRRLAEAIGKQAGTVHKTPDAPRLQDDLKPFYRLASAAVRLLESQDAFRVWLNAPHPHLDEATPLELIETGESQVVLDLLEDALLGHPS